MKKVVLKWGTTISSKITKTRLVRQSMANHVVEFPNPDPPLQEIEDKVDELEEAEAAADQGGTDRTIVRDARLAELTLLMQRVVLYVQLVSKGDPELVAKAGLDLEDERTRWPEPGKVLEFRADPGGNSGTVVLEAKAPKYKRMFVFERFEVISVKPVPVDGDSQTPPADTSSAVGKWEVVAVQGKGKLLVKDLTSGSHYRFRVAAVNAAGLGDYSDEVTCVAR
jgi:hypothetical protein